MAVKRFESEELTHLEAILAQLDMKMSALLSAIKGTGDRDLTTLETDLENIRGSGNRDLTTLETDIEDIAAKLGNRNSWQHGYITVSSAGNPVQGPDVAVAPGKAVVIIYHPDNTGKIGIGNSSENALLPGNGGSGEPIILDAKGQSLVLYISNLNLIWVDAAVSGEKVMWICET